MIEIIVREVAQERGITTIKALAERAALAYDTAADLWHGRMKRLDLEVFNRVCVALECSPSDLLRFSTEDEDPGNWQTLRMAA